ncbi:MAG: fumarylacetoacetase, partial [Janthinobacterium lividum]
TAAAAPTLNSFLGMGAAARRALRARLVELLDEAGPHRAAVEPHLRPARCCVPHLPATVGDYTDFFAGIHHATHTGRLLRPDAPLLPNYRHVPVAYHGRASSLVPSGQAIRRPHGQRRPRGAEAPAFTPSRNLDYELELAVWIGAGNPLGQPIPIAGAAEHIAGYGLLNDWSARDVQGWEAQPLGPFLAKSFATSVSPWIVTPEALAPFRVPPRPRLEGDPVPLPYLTDEADIRAGALDVTLEAFLLTPGMVARGSAPHRLSAASATHLYWTPAQMVAHHASGGCNLRPGDLFGSGTISPPGPGESGSLIELSEAGRHPVTLRGGESRRFLEDGDEVILRATCHRDGFASIGFGECRGVVLPA